ncbi:MAG: hypothetical protein HKO71_00300 [Pseudomonadales bacterium]|nr:hypothetical protein [Pseudomonadales bacterium]
MIIARSHDMGMAAVMQSLLIAEGVSVLPSAQSAHVSIAGADQSYTVQVAQGDAERARQLLAENGYDKFVIR